MNYYLDTEFHEYKKKVFPWSKGTPTIDLISIGIVAEDGREYYAISKDFDLKAAWNSYQMEQVDGHLRNRYPDGIREYRLRDNVLMPIWMELHKREIGDTYQCNQLSIAVYPDPHKDRFRFGSLKRLIKKYGKSNPQIAEEVKEFVYETNDNIHPNKVKNFDEIIKLSPIDFYAYFADYDWVVFCWLFGKMIDLPKGFPMYFRDLKQMLDEKLDRTILEYYGEDLNIPTLEGKLKIIKARIDYPKQTNEHNALGDAKWNKELHNFIKGL